MKVALKPFKITNEYVKNQTRFVTKECDEKVGDKRVFTKVQEVIFNEEPSFYNDGVGGENIKTTLTRYIYNKLGELLLLIQENSQVITKLNENGKIRIPNKPFVKSKTVTKICYDSDHQTITSYGYSNGYRKMKIDKKGGCNKEIYYNYSNGMPVEKK